MAVATKAFFDMTYDTRTTEAILFGDACYNVSGPMTEISRQWGMYQLSYGDTDPMLSDRDKYPNFFRIVPSDSDFNPARLALLRYFNWSIVGTLFQDASRGSARYSFAHNRFDSLVEHSKINITKVESFADDPSSAIQNLKDHDVRIIVGNFDENMARLVFCSARQKGMFGPRHQWIILGTYSNGWWKQPDNSVPCTPEELNETLHGYLSTDILPLSSDDRPTESGLTPLEYKELYENERGSSFSLYHGYAYDGIWVIARALEKLLNEDDDLEDTGEEYVSLERRLRGPRVGKALNDTDFLGVTGRVQFNNGDRLGSINIHQMQAGELIKVAEYSAHTEQLDFSKGKPIVWWRDDKPPKDRTVQYEELRHVSTPVYLSLVVLASTGIIMACCFLGLNIHFRRHRFIKMSSPNMNNVIIVGCVLCYISIILLGTDGSMASSSAEFFRFWCRARAWVLALGFTLAFGAMFSKTWRVHAIFTNIKLNRKVIKDYKLILVVMILVMLDVALLVAWQVVDPFQKAHKKLVPEVHEDYEIIPKLEFCSSRHMEIWMGSIYAYKGLLLAFGCFLAWETRQVSIPALNDSKYIGMSVYNVVIMCTCGAAVTFLIQDQPTHSFLIIAVFILFATTATLCLVFVPKIIQLRRDPKGEDKRIRATLRKPSNRFSDEDDHFQHKVRLVTEENRRLRGFLEQKAAEFEHLLSQYEEDPAIHDATVKAALHKTVLALRNTDNSPSKVSRASTQSDVMSTYSDTSTVTTTLFVNDSPPGKTLKTRLLNSRMRAESIELTDIRGNRRRKSSVTLPPQTGEEEEDDDPFGGVYLGPPDPPPVKKKPELFPPRRPSGPGNVQQQQQQENTGMANSYNSTACHEPPTLGLTTTTTTSYSSTSSSPFPRQQQQAADSGTGEMLQVGDLLKTWQEEEDGGVHYSKTPSVLLLQAGQQSRMGVASGRQQRASRRSPAPISIWTIAEVGEEDHAPGLGRDIEDYAHGYRWDVVPEEADGPPSYGKICGSAGYFDDKAAKDRLVCVDELRIERCPSDSEAYPGDSIEKKNDGGECIYKQPIGGYTFPGDDDQVFLQSGDTGLVTEGQRSDRQLEHTMAVSVGSAVIPGGTEGDTDATSSSAVAGGEICEASPTDAQGSDFPGESGEMIARKSADARKAHTPDDSLCDLEGYLGDVEDTSYSAVPFYGYLGHTDDTETQEVSASFGDLSLEDSLGDSDNCPGNQNYWKTHKECSPLEEEPLAVGVCVVPACSTHRSESVTLTRDQTIAQTATTHVPSILEKQSEVVTDVETLQTGTIDRVPVLTNTETTASPTRTSVSQEEAGLPRDSMEDSTKQLTPCTEYEKTAHEESHLHTQPQENIAEIGGGNLGMEPFDTKISSCLHKQQGGNEISPDLGDTDARLYQHKEHDDTDTRISYLHKEEDKPEIETRLHQLQYDTAADASLHKDQDIVDASPCLHKGVVDTEASLHRHKVHTDIETSCQHLHEKQVDDETPVPCVHKDQGDSEDKARVLKIQGIIEASSFLREDQDGTEARLRLHAVQGDNWAADHGQDLIFLCSESAVHQDREGDSEEKKVDGKVRYNKDTELNSGENAVREMNLESTEAEEAVIEPSHCLGDRVEIPSTRDRLQDENREDIKMLLLSSQDSEFSGHQQLESMSSSDKQESDPSVSSCQLLQQLRSSGPVTQDSASASPDEKSDSVSSDEQGAFGQAPLGDSAAARNEDDKCAECTQLRGSHADLQDENTSAVTESSLIDQDTGSTGESCSDLGDTVSSCVTSSSSHPGGGDHPRDLDDGLQHVFQQNLAQNPEPDDAHEGACGGTNSLKPVSASQAELESEITSTALDFDDNNDDERQETDHQDGALDAESISQETGVTPNVQAKGAAEHARKEREPAGCHGSSLRGDNVSPASDESDATILPTFQRRDPDRSSCPETNKSLLHKEVFVSKSHGRCHSVGEVEALFAGSSGKKTRTGNLGGSAQVYPEPSADSSSQQTLSAHGSDEELWACPASVTSSAQGSPSRRVKFSCDVIEKL